MLPHYVASGTTDRRDSGVGPLGGEEAHAVPGSGCQTRVGRTGSEFRGSWATAASSSVRDVASCSKGMNTAPVWSGLREVGIAE